LSFLSELRARFIDTLKLADEDVIFPGNSLYFVALGAAILSKDANPITAQDLYEKTKNIKDTMKGINEKSLPPLFKSKEDYEKFKEEHNKYITGKADLNNATGDVFLGLDAGSTTTKAVLIDANKNILYSWYMPNQGSPLNSAIEIVKDMYKRFLMLVISREQLLQDMVKG